MSRILNKKEMENYIENRTELHSQLSDIQADFEDMTDRELIEYRDTILNRINNCMALILESDEDNF